jgi:hypothetical protein
VVLVSKGARGYLNEAVEPRAPGLYVKPIALAIWGGGVLLLAWFAHSVCVRLSSDDLKSFNVPVEQRSDRDVFLFKTFQQRNGEWSQCKSWLSRQFFF